MEKTKKDKSSCQRKCIVSNQTFDKDMLIRFVIDLKGEVVPDIDEKLDGRGVWVKASKTDLDAAITKNLFSKSFKRKVTADKNLILTVEKILKQKCLNLISFAKKASFLVSGFEKVKVALKKGEVYLLFIACDGKENGVKKILPFTKPDLSIINLFNSIELGQTIGKDNTVFVAVKKSNLTEKLFAECNRFSKFIEKEL